MKPRARSTLLVSCEHGGNTIPPRYRALFRRHRAALASHRGYDPGALRFAREFAAAFGAPLVHSTVSRLLVELNRSPHHRHLFSEASRALEAPERARVLDRYYYPYRTDIEARVGAAAARGVRLVHLSSHSYTPVLDGQTRRADVGLLYDPGRPAEKALCLAWQRELARVAPTLVVRRNYPYRGYDDGLTTWLRQRYADNAYAGIELEVNQKFVYGEARAWRALRRTLISAFGAALAQRGS